MEKQSLHFPHIISANSVQESARLIQERYKEKTGHKLKRSVLLEGLSDALKYSNKKVLESKQGAVCVHKDIPLYLGASFYSIVGSYELESPRVFTGHSESEVLSKIADNLITDVWETQSLYCMEYFIGRIQRSSGLMALLKDSTQYIFSDTPYVNDNEAILSGEFVHDSRFTDFGCLIASRFAEIRAFREDIFKTLVDDCDSIEGSHVVEVVTEGDAQLIQSYLPSVETVMEDGQQITVLKGLVAASPLVVASYHNDLLWSFFVGVDYEVIDKIFTFENYDYSYEIAHNHGRKLKNAAEEVAVYVTLRLKEQEHIETAISAFLTNSI